MSVFYDHRFNRVISEMKLAGLEQFLLTDPQSIDYLTGISIDPGERLFALLIRSNGQHQFFINRLFPLPETPIKITSFSDTDNSTALLAAAVSSESGSGSDSSSKLGSRSVLGIDKNWPAHFLLSLMEACPQLRFQNASITVDRVRAIKDAEEQRLMREASAINDAAIEYASRSLRLGMTELELAQIIVDFYHRAGSPGPSFDLIVAFGEHAADPHHVNGDRRLEAGDVVLLDIGCIWQDYCSDMTRTFLTATPSDKISSVYNIVRDANLAAEAIIKPGVRMHEIDAAARDFITAAGYGPQFTHRLGHFIGREVHEFGDVSSTNDWVAEPGMIFSIEPGIYLPNEFGVRIEDLVLVTEDGCEILNRTSKDIQIVALADPVDA